MNAAELHIENPESKTQDHLRPRRRAVTAALVLYWIALFTATHLPRIPRPLELNVSDKWEHYAAYAILGLLLAARRAASGPLSWRAMTWIWAAAIVYGAFDELTQPLFGRHDDLLDWRADIVGSATGILVFAVLARCVARRRIAAGAD
jgi:VanZ family protein